MAKGNFITGTAEISQIKGMKGMYTLKENQLYQDEDGSINIHPRGFESDNFTWINSSDWDIRCSHGHDIGCKYHQIIKVKLTKEELIDKGILKYCPKGRCMVCGDIPTQYLEIVDITGHECNNLFYRMLKASDAPKYVQLLYRTGVSLNIGWFFSGKEKINVNDIYKIDCCVKASCKNYERSKCLGTVDCDNYKDKK